MIERFLIIFGFWVMFPGAVAAERPNVVFFLVDDLGWTDLKCYGSDYYETPNVDRLAKEGMLFTDAYAASCVCSPLSRQQSVVEVGLLRPQSAHSQAQGL